MNSIIDFERKAYFKKDWNKFNIRNSLLTFFRKFRMTSKKLTIIIHIYNSKKVTEQCLTTLIKNTKKSINIILIDDANTNSQIAKLLSCYQKLSSITVIRNMVNLGYTKSINAAIKSCKTDVILLNTDTVVTPYWTDNLQRCAYSSRDVGTVTPFSNNAVVFSDPKKAIYNEIPTWVENEPASNAITSFSSFSYPEISIGNGFCIYIKRKLIEDIAYFDEKRFQNYYDGVKDFCLRARKKGWKNKLDDSCYIFNTSTSCLDKNKQKLIQNNKGNITTKYPIHVKDNKKCQNSERILNTRKKIDDLFGDYELTFHLSRPTILYIFPETTSGIPVNSLDMFKILQDDYRILFFTSDRKILRLYLYYSGNTYKLNDWKLKNSLYPNDFSHKFYKHIATNILINYNIKIIHIKNLINHTFDFLFEAHKFGIKTIITFQNLYLICPSVYLLDENNIYCKGYCTKTKGECKTPFNFTKRISKLKNNWINDWKYQVSLLLDDIDYFITSSKFTKSTYTRNYPKLLTKDFEIIHHGTDLKHSVKLNPMSDNTKIKIICPVDIDNNEGLLFISKLIDFDKAKIIEIHIVGYLPKEALNLVEGRIINHGKYERDNFHLLVNKIKPHFVGLFSICNEIESNILNESWSCGVPVLVNSVGTLTEKLSENGGGGWELNCNNISESYKRIKNILNNQEDYFSHKKYCKKETTLSVYNMTKQYSHIYKILLNKDKLDILVNNNRILPNNVLKVGLIIPNKFASYFIRLENYLINFYTKDKITVFHVEVDSFINLNNKYNFDVVIIQRHAVSPNSTDCLIKFIKRNKYKLIYEVDDDLLNISDAYYKSYSKSIKNILKNSLCVTTTTKSLKLELLKFNKELNIKVVKNRINEKIWGSVKINLPTPRTFTSFLYMGTKTHIEDLKLVLPSLRLIALKYSIRLTLVGITDQDFTESFIKRINVPIGYHDYPHFIRTIKAQNSLYDVGLAPLLNTHLNKHKSNLKYLDYTALGIPGIYSNVGPYTDTIIPNMNGLLVNSSTEEWYKSIENMIINKDLRNKLIKNAVHDINSNYLLEDDPYALYEIINQVIKQ